MSASWSFDGQPRNGDPLLPGAAPGAIWDALLPEDRTVFEAAYQQALTPARDNLDLTELFQTLEHWRRLALLQRDPAVVSEPVELPADDPPPSIRSVYFSRSPDYPAGLFAILFFVYVFLPGTQVYIWWAFMHLSVRHQMFNITPTYYFFFGNDTSKGYIFFPLILTVGLFTLMYMTVRATRLMASKKWVSSLFVYTASLITVMFSYFYWDIGTTDNFNVELSHFQAVYFAIGTLSTAGTGFLYAKSELAMYEVGIQMVVDLAFVAWVVTTVVDRLKSPSRQRTRNDRPRPPTRRM